LVPRRDADDCHLRPRPDKSPRFPGESRVMIEEKRCDMVVVHSASGRLRAIHSATGSKPANTRPKPHPHAYDDHGQNRWWAYEMRQFLQLSVPYILRGFSEPPQTLTRAGIYSVVKARSRNNKSLPQDQTCRIGSWRCAIKGGYRTPLAQIISSAIFSTPIFLGMPYFQRRPVL
jgi:hypothetical protein